MKTKISKTRSELRWNGLTGRKMALRWNESELYMHNHGRVSPHKLRLANPDQKKEGFQMKNKPVLLFCLLAVPFVVLAQTNTNSIPTPPGAVPGTAPGMGLLITILPLLVPIIIAGFKVVLPKLPGWTLPIIAPALGALIDYIGSLTPLGTGAAHPLLAAALGSAGVGLREMVTQVRDRAVLPPSTPPTT